LKEPSSLLKEPCAFSKEPYTFFKEPYIDGHEGAGGGAEENVEGPLHF